MLFETDEAEWQTKYTARDEKLDAAKNLFVHSLIYGETNMFDSLFTNDYIDSATKAYIKLLENKRIFTL